MISNSCQLSSLIFIINIILGFYNQYILYAILFICLTITSLFYHTYYTQFTYIIDKVSILYVVLYGALLFFQKVYLISIKNINFINIIMSIIIVLTFIYVNFIYYYGYYNNQYCFNDNINISYKYHSLIHYISSFSHALIMLL